MRLNDPDAVRELRETGSVHRVNAAGVEPGPGRAVISPPARKRTVSIRDGQ